MPAPDPQQVSVFDPHHTVLIKYPDARILESDNELLMLTTPLDHANRYNPALSLIADPDVEAVAGRMNDRETSFFSITPASFTLVANWASEGLAPEVQMVENMAIAVAANGITELHVATFTWTTAPVTKRCYDDATGSERTELSPSHDEDQAMVRIRQHTTLGSMWDPIGPSTQTFQKTYTMTTATFDAIHCGEQWLEDMRDLIQGRSDRAVRHVEVQLEAQNMESPAVAWMVRDRKPSFEHLFKPIEPDTLADVLTPEDQLCNICRREYSAELLPVILHHSSHSACVECLTAWCVEKGPGVSCPQCRTRLFDLRPTFDKFYFGESDKRYEHDNAFDEWENHMRSQADLDKASGSLTGDYAITIWSDVAIQVWTHLVNLELLESSASTPYHLQPARAPEYDLLFATVKASLESLDGADGMFHSLCDAIHDDVGRAFARACLRGNIRSAIGFVDRHKFFLQGGTHCLRRYGLRPGFMEFVTRTLTRTLQFMRLRVCDDCGDGADTLFHDHGLRRYYNSGCMRAERDAAQGG